MLAKHLGDETLMNELAEDLGILFEMQERHSGFGSS